MFDHTGRVALVTGRSSGLGARAAMTLARAGARVAVAGRRSDRLADVVRTIERHGGESIPVRLDLSDLASVRDCLDAAEGRLGAVEILVNNAGATRQESLLDVIPETFDRLIDTNVRVPSS